MKNLKPLARILCVPAMLFIGACSCQKDVAVAPEPPHLRRRLLLLFLLLVTCSLILTSRLCAWML